VNGPTLPRLLSARRQPLAAEGVVLQREFMADLLADAHLLGLALGQFRQLGLGFLRGSFAHGNSCGIGEQGSLGRQRPRRSMQPPGLAARCWGDSK